MIGFTEGIILAAAAVLIYKIYRGYRHGPERLICKSCGHAGQGKTDTRGSLLIEIALWLCFIIPGVIYTLWRLTTRGDSCESCGSRDLIPADSPIGKQLREQLRPK